MQYTGFIKRFLPFALTFAAGLFIASFFVTIGFPKFGSRHRENRQVQIPELRIEVQQLRKEKCDLRRQLDEMKANPSGMEPVPMAPEDMDFSMPVPPPVPAAPAAPHRHR